MRCNNQTSYSVLLIFAVHGLFGIQGSRRQWLNYGWNEKRRSNVKRFLLWCCHMRLLHSDCNEIFSLFEAKVRSILKTFIGSWHSCQWRRAALSIPVVESHPYFALYDVLMKDFDPLGRVSSSLVTSISKRLVTPLVVKFGTR